MQTLYDLLAAAAATDPAAPALLAPGRAPLAFGMLIEHIVAVRTSLNGRGFGPGDRIAVYAQRGPDAATAVLAAMCSATCVPLNPHLTPTECAAIFSRTRIRAMLAPAGADSPARLVALRTGIDVLDWRANASSAPGRFLQDDGRSAAADRPAASLDDIALIVLTSGTTSEPKIVPTSHRNLIARAYKSARLFGHGRHDRCLNLMPLCYTHGICSGLIGSLASGGGVICPERFDAATLFACVNDLHPTWLTGAASYHQAILEWLRLAPDALSGHTLRFARAASAPLPAAVQQELEERLGIPIIEGYGASEANVITSNPPDGPRKRGTVGRSPDRDVAVLGDDGRVLPPGTAGEVAVCGPTVIAGYEGDAESTREAFRDGWYRTGDLGVFDADGYLTLVGRIKDIINRGGEKISPQEVDAALLAHPDVAEAATFAIRHPTLQEDVAAAVVLRPLGSPTATEANLRRFLLQRLTPFKVPRRILIVEVIPKGPTGKILRHDLAQRVGVEAAVPRPGGWIDPAWTPMLQTILALFREVLKRDDVRPDDDFFLSGGDSLSAVELIVRIEDELRLTVPLLAVMETPTPRELARRLEDHPPDISKDVLGVNVGGDERPVFGVCGRYGHAVRLLLVGRTIGSQQPFYGLQPPGMNWERAGCTTMQEMAAHYVARVRAIQARGPYRLLGTSFGGLVVFEMAQQLRAAGEQVDFLGLVDTRPCSWRWRNRTHPSASLALADEPDSPVGEIETAGLRVARAHVAARGSYVLDREFDGELTYFYCGGHEVLPGRDRRRLWRHLAARMRLIQVPGLHGTFHEEPQFSPFCEALRSCLAGSTEQICESIHDVYGRYRLLREKDGDVIRASSGRTFRVSMEAQAGRIESVTFDDERRTATLRGWALDPVRLRPASMLLVFSDGRYVGRGGTGLRRYEAAEDNGRYVGFSLTVGLGLSGGERPRLRLFSTSSSGVAAEVPLSEPAAPARQSANGFSSSKPSRR